MQEGGQNKYNESMFEKMNVFFSVFCIT